jgi:iron complex outermembrane receptor protein
VAPATAPEPPFPTTLCPLGPQTGCLFIRTDRFETNFTSTIGSTSVQYRWSPALMTYLSWSQGFKSGGFNQRYNAAPSVENEPLPFRAETAETFELGFKSNPAEGLRLNGALFHTSYDDMQLTSRLGVVNLLFNPGAAIIEGGELELAWSPTADLDIDASAGYLDNHYDEINLLPPVGGQTPTAVATIDKKLPFTPEWQWHVGASYAFHLSDALMLTPRLDVSYTDSQFFDAVNTPEIAQLDAVTVVNGTLALEDAGGNWRLALRGDNLTDEIYPLAGTSSLTTATGYAEIIYARPRSFSLSATLNY